MRDEIYLVDTSVWIEVLPVHRPASALRERVDSLIAVNRVATTGMVRMEVLTGARSETEYSRLSGALSALHLLSVAEEHWDEAARLGFALRREGLVLPSADLLIAAVAMSARTVLLHRDRHFDVIAAHFPLLVESHLTS